MALATLRPLFPPPAASPAPCCLTRRHDAHHLARSAAAIVRPGTILDVGCGSGGVAIPLLHARPDVRIVGVEVDREEARQARRRAAFVGVADRLRVVHGDAFAAPLPAVHSVLANPPMLPTEPYFLVPRAGGAPEPFAHALLRRVATRGTTDVWLHAFDFLGLERPTGEMPSLLTVAADLGFEISYPHRGWRQVGPASAIREALPELARLFPEAVASVDGRERRFAELPAEPSAAPGGSLLIRHSIVRLNRPALDAGGPR